MKICIKREFSCTNIHTNLAFFNKFRLLFGKLPYTPSQFHEKFHFFEEI